MHFADSSVTPGKKINGLALKVVLNQSLIFYVIIVLMDLLLLNV